MRTVFILFLMFPVLALAQVGGKGDFIPNLEDVPRMPTMEVIHDQGFVFDAPAARVVEVYTLVLAADEEIAQFYDNSLIQLGWARSARNTYTRNDEKLTIIIEADGDSPDNSKSQKIVRFLLSPAGPHQETRHGL